MTSSAGPQNPWGVPPPPPITVSDFFNAARKTVSLLVEGGSDARFWESRVDRRHCLVFPLNGKSSVWNELNAARSAGKPAFVAVLDADFDRLEGTLVDDPDVIWTDFHDLETVILHSPALEKVLAEVGSRQRCDEFEKKQSIREALFANTIPLGRLRWLSLRRSLDLIFKKRQRDQFRYVDYPSFCDRNTWIVDIEKMVQRVLDFANRHDLQVDTLLQEMNALPDVDPLQIVVGHDLVGILQVGLRSKLGNEHTDIEELQRYLRVAFERGDLEKTSMYNALRAWEQRHDGFRIFAS